MSYVQFLRCLAERSDRDGLPATAAQLRAAADELTEAIDLLRTIPAMTAAERYNAGGTVENPEPLSREAVERDEWYERWSRVTAAKAAEEE